MPWIEEFTLPGETREQTAERLCEDGGYASLQTGEALHPAARALAVLPLDQGARVLVRATVVLQGGSYGGEFVLTPEEFRRAMRAAAVS